MRTAAEKAKAWKELMRAIKFKSPHDTREVKGIIFTASLGNDDNRVCINLEGIDNQYDGDTRWDIVLSEDGTWCIS